MFSPRTWTHLNSVACLGHLLHFRWLLDDGSLGSIEFGHQLRGRDLIDTAPDKEVARRLFDDDRRVTHRIVVRKKWRPMLWWSRSTRTLACCPHDDPRKAMKVELSGYPSDVVYEFSGRTGQEWLQGREYEVIESARIFEDWTARPACEIQRHGDESDSMYPWPMESVGPVYSTIYASNKWLEQAGQGISETERERFYIHHHDDYPGGRCEDWISASLANVRGVPHALSVRGPRLDVEARGIVF